eukprot:gnl/MRDRNA2_/MRDRNA2_34253_c0_seq1.p1 gnl/MRDRNA2_/MRDRNA2_34253_c0~~gnl/MRDRNA2_/MRDRNA2_34253_c0_seq1.p1  ORF type:complete len:457 (+),score=98.89 gnl/MRDRNA2_/MRDRNA2_34253_c0_seq1:105-1475(+)
MNGLLTVSICAFASAHGIHDGKMSDPYKLLDWERHKREHHVEEQRKGSWGGNPVICPFLQKLVPKAEKWGMAFEEFVAMLQAKDSGKISEWFAADATLAVYNSSIHDGNAVGQWVTASGQNSIKEYFESELKNLEQVRGIGLYPDFGRKGGMMEIEVFARCPHSGMLFSSIWVIQAFVTPKQPKEQHNDHDDDHDHYFHHPRLSKAQIWKSTYHQSGSAVAPPRPLGLASNVSEWMGQVIAKKDCSKFVEMVDENAVIEIADAFYHKDPEDMMHMLKDVTSLKGKDQFTRFCNEYIEHQAKVVPVQFLDMQQTIEAGQSVVLKGHIAMRSVFSPKMMDWAGAAKVSFSNTGKIVNMQLYPTEVLRMTEKWSWKYGQGATFNGMQKLTMKTIQLFHAHPYASGATAVVAALLILIAICRPLVLILSCCIGKCGKRRVCARELERPLQTVQAQPVELQ